MCSSPALAAESLTTAPRPDDNPTNRTHPAPVRDSPSMAVACSFVLGSRPVGGRVVRVGGCGRGQGGRVIRLGRFRGCLARVLPAAGAASPRLGLFPADERAHPGWGGVVASHAVLANGCAPHPGQTPTRRTWWVRQIVGRRVSHHRGQAPAVSFRQCGQNRNAGGGQATDPVGGRVAQHLRLKVLGGRPDVPLAGERMVRAQLSGEGLSVGAQVLLDPGRGRGDLPDTQGRQGRRGVIP